MAAVSRQKNDGSWWFHGVVKCQAANFQYTEVHLESGMHFQNVAVLYAVREELGEEGHGEGVEVGEEENDADVPVGEESGEEDHGEGLGEEDNDADWTDMVMIMI